MLAVCIAMTVGWYVMPREIAGIELLSIESVVLFGLWLSYAIGVLSKIMNNKVWHYFGGISMEMYLAHMIVFRVIEKFGLLYKLGSGWLAFLFVCVIEIILLVVGIEIYKKVFTLI